MSIAPVTREEKILSGEDIQPKTRFEYFLKEASKQTGDSDLPSYTASDNGKVLGLAETDGTVAPAWQTPSAPLICNTSYDNNEDIYFLDKTAGEIYDALLAGTPVYIKFQYGTPTEKYEGTLYLAPVIRFSNYNYTHDLKIYASRPSHGVVSGTDMVGLPGVLTYSASGLDEYPVFNNSRTSVVKTDSVIEDSGIIN